MADNSRRIEFDWNRTTWQGSQREQITRWARMSLDEILEAQEEMADLARELSDFGARAAGRSPQR
jgi:hypothetical protein